MGYMYNDLTYVMTHPMIEHKMATIRNKDTNSKEFHQNVYEVSLIVASKVSENFSLKEIEIETPLCKTKAKVLDKEIVLVPILRAGLGFVDGFRDIIPDAKVGFLAMARNEETLEPMEYYAKLPNNLADAHVIVLDPMLATGGSAEAAIRNLKAKGAKDITFVGLVGAPEGVKLINEKHSDVSIVLATLDDHLNEKGYIVPGLGDCGDRLFDE